MSITPARSVDNQQLKNRNYLSGVGFNFTIARAPYISFTGNQVNIPGLSCGFAEQPTYLKNIPIPGDKPVFEDLNVRFLIDEELLNYMEIQRWIRGINYPESLSEIYNFQKQKEQFTGFTDQKNLYSDATMVVLNSKQLPQFQVKFENIFPYALSAMQMDATVEDYSYFTAEVSFKYTIYDIYDMKNKKL
jgi:hypothetical protein